MQSIISSCEERISVNDQSKTTLITIAVRNWTEMTDCSMSSRFSAAHAIAVQIASRCQMDIMSLAYQPLGTEENPDCITTVVYVNNGRSLDDIRRIMKPEMDNYPRVYWMIQDLSVWQGTLECIVTTRGTKEEWR
jgi:hypothetical protein